MSVAYSRGPSLRGNLLIQRSVATPSCIEYDIDVKIVSKSNRDILYHPDMHPQTHILIQIESYSAILPPHRSRFHSQAEALTYFYAGSSLSSIPFLID